jgi:hypothetical protein
MDPNVIATLAEVRAEYDETVAYAQTLGRQIEQLEARLEEPRPKAKAKSKRTKSKQD